jgi:hypothetical protein
MCLFVHLEWDSNDWRIVSWLSFLKSDDFVNVKSILRRLYNRMDHPNPYIRLGASMAAYRIYPVLRGTPSIVDRYIFEMIYFCIKSLRLAEADDSQIGIHPLLHLKSFNTGL